MTHECHGMLIAKYVIVSAICAVLGSRMCGEYVCVFWVCICMRLCARVWFVCDFIRKVRGGRGLSGGSRG